MKRNAKKAEKRPYVYRCVYCRKIALPPRPVFCPRCGAANPMRREDPPLHRLAEAGPGIGARIVAGSAPGREMIEGASFLGRQMLQDAGDAREEPFLSDYGPDNGGDDASAHREALVEDEEVCVAGNVKGDGGDYVALDTGVEGFDLVASGKGGIVRPISYLLAGAEGGGKSRLARRVAAGLIERHRFRVLYGCAEETKEAIVGTLQGANLFSRAVARSLFIKPGTTIERLLDTADEIEPDLLIVDSTNEYVSESVRGDAGTPRQIVNVAKRIHRWTHRNNDRTSIQIAQLNADDKIAGPRVFRHAVDGTLQLEKVWRDGMESPFRKLTAGKNRRNRDGVFAWFRMTEHSIAEWDPEDERKRVAPDRVARRKGVG